MGMTFSLGREQSSGTHCNTQEAAADDEHLIIHGCSQDDATNLKHDPRGRHCELPARLPIEIRCMRVMVLWNPLPQEAKTELDPSHVCTAVTSQQVEQSWQSSADIESLQGTSLTT